MDLQMETKLAFSVAVGVVPYPDRNYLLLYRQEVFTVPLDIHAL